MPDPKISVIMPYYNSSAYVHQAIGSILRQAYEPLEILFVDDGSTDNIAASLEVYKPVLRYFHQENQGPSVARNLALQHATGEFIAFLDADDIWPEGKLALQAGYLLRHPEKRIVTGHIQYIWSGVEREHLYFRENNTLVHVHLGAALVRREVFDEVGMFDPAIRFNEDLDWYFRLHEHGVALKVLEDITLIYRRHAESLTRNKNPSDTRLLKVLKASLDRRRQMTNDGMLEYHSLFGFR